MAAIATRQHGRGHRYPADPRWPVPDADKEPTPVGSPPPRPPRRLRGRSPSVSAIKGRWMAAVLAGGPGHRPQPPRRGGAAGSFSHLTRGRHRHHRSGHGRSKETQRPAHPPVPPAPARDHRAGRHRRHHSRPHHGRSTPRAAPEIHRRALRQAEFKNLDLAGLETDGTRSEPEGEFLRLCRRHRMPRARGQPTDRAVHRRLPVAAGAACRRGRRLDSSHRGRQAFEDDHERDLYLRTNGYRVLRFTARQIARDPRTVAGILRTKLGV